jgi:uncharacterized protein
MRREARVRTTIRPHLFVTSKRSRVWAYDSQLMSSLMARELDGALVVDVLVQPRASRAGVGPVVGERLRVSVTAPPVDGEANAAVIEALAKAFGVRRAAVSIVRGETGRRKTVKIAGVGRAALVKLGY